MGGILIEYEVTKAIIVVSGYANLYLMSVKRDPGSSNEGKLEFLGGRIEENESPFDGVIRELSEEESTGELARLVKNRSPLHIQQPVQNAMHYLFLMEIELNDYAKLQHDPGESYGFRLVGSENLRQCQQRFTRKTNSIIEILDLPNSSVRHDAIV